jgi:hypothetical protein
MISIATMTTVATPINVHDTVPNSLVDPSRRPRKTTMKPSAAPTRSESSTWVAVHVPDAGLTAKKTAAAAAAALNTIVASKNAGRPPSALRTTT